MQSRMQHVGRERSRRGGRWGRLLLVGLAALLLASACGDEQPRVFADGIEPVGDCPDSRRRDDGTCRPESTAPEPATVPGGFGVATFQLDPDNPPDPEAPQLHVLATERECASGQPPTGREVQPMVAETEDAVEITILVETMRDADCPSNPSFPLTIELARPLGDRIIRDAALRPPVERPWPIPLRDSRLEIAVAGDPPGPGTANAIGWNGDYGGALLITGREWNPGFVQGFSGSGTDMPSVITGFVASCEGGACEMECENADSLNRTVQVEGDPNGKQQLPDCADIPRLGEECTQEYTPVEGEDVLFTVRFSGTTCTIEVTATPVDG